MLHSVLRVLYGLRHTTMHGSLEAASLSLLRFHNTCSAQRKTRRDRNLSLVEAHASPHVSTQNCRGAFRSGVFATFRMLPKALNILKIHPRIVCIYIWQLLVPSNEGLFCFLSDVLTYLLGRISSSRIVSSGSRRISCSGVVVAESCATTLDFSRNVV